MYGSVFWREKGTKMWREGWVTSPCGTKIKIGSYNGDPRGVWYDRKDVDIEKRR